jgi:hypothetical protein
MASCLHCSEWIVPQRWTCEKCEEQSIKVYEDWLKKAKEKDKERRGRFFTIKGD